ncbi:MAG: hypothetical protein Unbinned3556contig1001_14 [Prokaryotic dsDNA virus sp.]|nr:MAG: hypothetical protein Unbinned3556contig1001_14 [Prokaryotic dsDNA virus sp.]
MCQENNKINITIILLVLFVICFIGCNMIIYEIIANLFILAISVVLLAVGSCAFYILINEILRGIYERK